MIDAIHIGDYKTGTSWLQLHAFQQHPELVYLDWPVTHPEIAGLFYELTGARDLDFDPIGLRARFQEQIDCIDRNGKKLIVSREALSGEFVSGDHAKRIAERLYQVFGKTRILLVIREQFSMLVSIYSQYVKIGGTLSLRDFVQDPLISNQLIRRLQYEKQINAYVELFGVENVHVKLYEESRRDKANFLREILSFFGCRDVDFKPEESGLTNPSLTSIGAAIQRVLNRFIRTHTNPSANVLPLDKLLALLLSPAKKESLLRSAAVQLPGAAVFENPEPYLLYSINMALNLRLSEWCEKIRIGGKLQIPADIRERLTPAFKQGNQRLLSQYGLNLGKCGWVL